MTPLEEFDNTMKVTKFNLFLSGVNLNYEKWEYFKVSQFQKLMFYMNILMLDSGVIGILYFAYDGCFIEYSAMLPCVTISIVGTVKSYFIFKNNGLVLQIVNTLRDMHPKAYSSPGIGVLEDKSTLRDKITKEAMTLLKRNLTMLFFLGTCVLIMFCLTPLALMILEYSREGIFKVQFPYLVKYFFDVYNSPFWYLEYLHHIYATGVVFVNIFGNDALFHTICTYIGMHFKLLCLEAEYMAAPKMTETNKNFLKFVKQHQKLIDLVDKSEIVYTNSMLFNIVTSSLLICLSAFNMTVAEEFDIRVTYFLFLLLSLSQIFLICYFADNLMQASTGVSEAIYKCNWYNFDASTKKGIVLILLRAQSPCKLTAANFADLNLNAFTTILSRSWSLFALLKTVYN